MMPSNTNRYFFAFSVVVCLFSPSPGPAQDDVLAGLSIQDALERAVRSHESLDLQSERMVQAEQSINQTRASSLPDLRFEVTTTLQDTRRTSTDGGEGATNTLTKRRRTESRFTLEQPLFHGLKDFHAISALKAQQRRQQWAFQSAAAAVMEQTIASYYQVFSVETALSNVRDQMAFIGERISELRQRVALGKSRDSEVLTAESDQASARAREELLKADNIAARENLSYWVAADARQAKLLETLEPVSTFPSLDQALKKAQDRSDLAALREDIEARRYGIKMARADYWPGADLTGHYYTQRPGFQSEIDWDVIFNIDVPLYRGGATRALDKIAQSQYRAAQKEYARLARVVENEIRQRHAALIGASEQAKALKVAYEKARRSYDLQKREYRLGIVDNLDVLQALNQMQRAKEQWDASVVRAKMSGYALKIAMEDFPQ